MAQRRAPCFKLQLAGGTDVRERIFGKIAAVRKLYDGQNQAMDNASMIDRALTQLLETLRKYPDGIPNMNCHVPVEHSDNNDETNQSIFMTTESSLSKLIEAVHNHGNICSGKLGLTHIERKGHVLYSKVTCSKGRNKHQFQWSSSPYMPDGKYYINRRMAFGYLTSGMLPVQYTSMCNAAKIGTVPTRQVDSITKDLFKHAAKARKDSTDFALCEEIEEYDDLSGIDIQTDARFGTRKNSKDSSVVCIGERTKKVLVCANVSAADEPISQRHELIGTKRIYKKLEKHPFAATHVRVHAHDNNASVNKLAHKRAEINQNETWHGAKALKKALKVIASGTLKSKGVTWHEELKDKVDKVTTHVRWAMRNCDEDADVLRLLIMQCVEHLKNNHTNCHPTSHCQTDPNYELSTTVITSPVAENLLRHTLQKCAIYRKTEDYRLARDTYHVESFNNTMCKFQDKRISFSTKQYCYRSDLAVLHWNENVNRRHTSYYNPPGTPHDARRPGKKNLARPTYGYIDAIWQKYMKKLYSG